MTWKISIVFVVLATLIIILMGWLVSIRLVPIDQTFKDTALQFTRVWRQLAIAIGLILPNVTFIVWVKRPVVRRIFGFYLLLLGIQIMTEIIVFHSRFSSLVVVSGTVYTVFRVWQLWRGLHLIKTMQPQHKLISNVLWLMLSFWSSNLITLLTLRWPSILAYN